MIILIETVLYLLFNLFQFNAIFKVILKQSRKQRLNS